MALLAWALMPTAAVKQELKERSQEFDAILERRINGLTSTFEKETGLYFVERDLEGFRISGNGRRDIYVPTPPVQEVTRIEIRNDNDESVYATITAASSFVLKDARTGYLQLLDGNVFICGTKNVLLDMTVGFEDSAAELAEAQRLFLVQLSYEYKRWQNNESGVVAKSYGDGNVSFAPPTNLLREVMEGLEGLQRHRVR